MTRILYWNIENFSINKLNDPQKLNYIQQVLTQNPPHIIVIVEVSASNAFGILDGVLLPNNGGGANGVLQLLVHLRTWLNNNWCLVPPLTLGNSGYREGVAVYFDSNQLQFTGPYWWIDNFNFPARGIPRRRLNPINRSVPHTYPEATRVAYGGIWANCLPVANVNANSLYNPSLLGQGLAQNTLAGQFQYFTPAPNRQEIFFPDGRFLNQENSPPSSRSPFLTTFYEPATNRNIKLFAVHTSPNTAPQAVQQLANVQEIQDVNANEVSVIVGDFNVDSFTDFNNYLNLINPLLVGLGYTMHLNPRGANGLIDVARQPYCMTHLLPIPRLLQTTARATPYNQSQPAGLDPHNNTGIPQRQLPNLRGLRSPGGAYPSFGYMGSMSGFLFSEVTYAASIDNIFTRYGNNLQPPANHNMTIINPVVGSPYNNHPAANPPAAGVPLGNLDFFDQQQPPQPQLANPLPVGGIDRANDQANNNADLIQFHQVANYGHIRSTSDHLALIIDV